MELKTTVAGKSIFKTVATDGDWSTKFHWIIGNEEARDFGVRHESVAELTWAIPAETSEGVYRICYHGDHQTAKGAKVVPFSGCTSEFVVHA